MSRSETAAVAALVAALGFVLSLGWLLPLDEVVYRLIQFRRTCAFHSAAGGIDPLVRGILGVIAVAVIVTGGSKRPSFVLLLVGLVVSGAAAGEVLKTIFERIRPNEPPGDLSGNSFPSGHVMNTTMAAVAVIALAREAGWPWVARAAVGAVTTVALGAQVFFRLVNGSHWASDVPPSILLGIAWMCGARPVVVRSPRAAAAVVMAAAVAFAVFYRAPALRLRLPSLLAEARAALTSFDASTPALVGGWSRGWREPVGPVAWALEPRVALELGGIARARTAVLKTVLRPPGEWEGAQGCQRIVVTVNGWTSPAITLLEGWREYHVPLPEMLLGAEGNEVRLEILDDIRRPESRAPGLTAFHSLRIEPE